MNINLKLEATAQTQKMSYWWDNGVFALPMVVKIANKTIGIIGEQTIML